MPTRNDVARLAGTSPAVVSYVLNDGPRNVSPATREKVLRAVAELGYRPNGVARALRGGRSRTIGLIVPDNSNPFFAALARAVEDAAFARGYAVLLGNSTESAEREQRYLATFLERQVEAIMLISVDGEPELSPAQRVGTPVILLDRQVSGGGSTVVVDNEGGAYEATRHLLDHGHRAVACVSGPVALPGAVERLRGWRTALGEVGAVEVLRSAPYSRTGGYRAGRELLSATPRPTAVFVASEPQAIGVLRAAAELGVAVPDELALVTFDGTEDGEFTNPPLSTVRQPVEQLAARAMDVLLDDAGRRHHVVPFELVLRRSCGCGGHGGGEEGE